MCLLTFAHGGSTPTYDDMRQAARNNPDGFGWAIVDPDEDEIYVDWSMDFEAAWATFAKARAEYPDGPMLFHHRFATHGTETIHNCHPFWVGDGTIGDEGRRGLVGDTLMAHNGILHIDMDKGEWRSDTGVFAEDYFPALGGVKSLNDDEFRFKLGKDIGYGNKLVFLTVSPLADHNFYIINESQGHWRKGVWYSNYSYHYSQPRRYSSAWGYDSTDYWWEKDDADNTSGVVSESQPSDWDVKACPVCTNTVVIKPDVPDSHVCAYCDCCTVCMEWYKVCECNDADISEARYEPYDVNPDQVHGFNDDDERTIEPYDGGEDRKAMAELMPGAVVQIVRNNVTYIGQAAMDILEQEAKQALEGDKATEWSGHFRT